MNDILQPKSELLTAFNVFIYATIKAINQRKGETMRIFTQKNKIVLEIQGLLCQDTKYSVLFARSVTSLMQSITSFAACRNFICAKRNIVRLCPHKCGMMFSLRSK